MDIAAYSAALPAAVMATVIVSVGSTDGVLTTATVLRTMAVENPSVVFTQAFQVHQLDPTTWGEPGQRVVFVDLAVNNGNEEMTEEFVRRIVEAGHVLVGIVDEHDAAAWRRVLGKVSIDFESLLVKPMTATSSGAVLYSFLGAALMRAADMADGGVFGQKDGTLQERIAWYTNAPIKAAAFDNRRREYITRHFALHTEPDEIIIGWAEEYEEMERNLPILLHAAIVEKDLVTIDARGKRIDATAVMKAGYALGTVVHLLHDHQPGHSFGVNQDAGIDILTLLRGAGIQCTGFALKANVADEHAEAAVVAVQRLRDSLLLLSERETSGAPLNRGARCWHV